MVISEGSRSGESLADSMAIPVIQVTPTEGETMNPVIPFVPASKFRYFAVVPSMALATPSEPGLFAEEAMMGSPGWQTLAGRYCP